MSSLDRPVLAEKATAVLRHLERVAACLQFKLGTPASYPEAFRRLGEAGLVAPQLAERLARAAGFRNVVAHAYERLDMARIHRVASRGPADLEAFLAALRDRLSD